MSESAAEWPRVRAFLHVTICTGARKEAILSVRWNIRVDLERRTLRPRFKVGGKPRSTWLPMTESAYAHLTAGHMTASTRVLELG